MELGSNRRSDTKPTQPAPVSAADTNPRGLAARTAARIRKPKWRDSAEERQCLPERNVGHAERIESNRQQTGKQKIESGMPALIPGSRNPSCRHYGGKGFCRKN